MQFAKHLMTVTALAAAGVGFAGSADASTFLCNPAPGTCSFDGVTGGYGNIKRNPGQTASDTFSILFPSAGVATLTFTTAKLTFSTTTFDGLTFTPVAGQSYIFNIAAAGTYDLVAQVINSTKAVSAYSGTIDFAAVPEPAGWAMLLGGFGLVGFAVRRRAAPVLARA